MYMYITPLYEIIFDIEYSWQTIFVKGDPSFITSMITQCFSQEIDVLSNKNSSTE